MRTTVCWIVGEPGIGKTTLARLLLGQVQQHSMKPKLSFGASVVAAGHYIGKTFDGADTISYTGAEEVVTCWLYSISRTKYPLFLLDGDRMSNQKVVDLFRTGAPDARLCCIHLTGAAGLAAERRRQRGSNQNEQWLKGRLTKSARFAVTFGDKLELDAAKTPPMLLELAKDFLKKEST